MTALAAYRSILRATRVAFAGDHRVLHAARSQARSQFNSDRLMVPNSSEADARIAHANEVAVFLRQNVVQGEKKEGGEEQEYKIKIHAETERGDNETIKSAGKVDRGKTDLSGTGAKFRKCS